jgi:hypothetical protein
MSLSGIAETGFEPPEREYSKRTALYNECFAVLEQPSRFEVNDTCW